MSQGTLCAFGASGLSFYLEVDVRLKNACPIFYLGHRKDPLDKKIIASIRNNLQSPKTVLEQLSKNKVVPKTFSDEALEELNKAVQTLKNLMQE